MGYVESIIIILESPSWYHGEFLGGNIHESEDI